MERPLWGTIRLKVTFGLVTSKLASQADHDTNAGLHGTSLRDNVAKLVATWPDLRFDPTNSLEFFVLLDFSTMSVEELAELAKFTQSKGWSWEIKSSTDAELKLAVRKFVEESGPTKAVSYGSLNEDVLPDGTSRGVLIDQLRLKVKLCSATQSFLVIDPYLFPSGLDQSYEDDLVALLEGIAGTVTTLTLITKANRNQVMEANVKSRLINSLPNMTVASKYTNVFHDRFWVADEQRGIFVGTSLSGLGKRYALLDYLAEDDARSIAARANQLP